MASSLSLTQGALFRPDMDALPKLAETFHISVDELMLAKTAEEGKPRKKTGQELTALICKCITVAMGVAVTALSGLGATEADTAMSLLGIGVAAAGSCLLTK